MCVTAITESPSYDERQQLGCGFPGTTWLQWNARFRDDVRRFLKGDPGMVPDLMRRIYGSDDLFPDSRADACHAFQRVNYIDSHDGFTLYGLVAYNKKNNWSPEDFSERGLPFRHSTYNVAPRSIVVLNRASIDQNR